jgi:hypothetical protein
MTSEKVKDKVYDMIYREIQDIRFKITMDLLVNETDDGYNRLWIDKEFNKLATNLPEKVHKLLSKPPKI